MQKLRSTFQQLRWKLTLSYTAVTVGALLAVELVLLIAGVLLVGSVVRSDYLPRILATNMREVTAPQFRSYLAEEPPDIEGLNEWLRQLSDAGGGAAPSGVNISFVSGEDELIVVDENGTVMTAWPPEALPELPLGEPLARGMLPGPAAPLNAALAGVSDEGLLFEREDGTLAIAAPIYDSEGEELLGAAVQYTAFPGNVADIYGQLAVLVGVSAIAFTVVAGAVGTLFGFLTARALTRRLDRLTTASDAWSQGDFSTFVEDPAGDELGQLARRLNRMAEQLQNLMTVRQDVAALEERNRIARELHDSAKQQAFAVAAQLGAAKALLEIDPSAAQERLAEAEKLTDDLRKELTSLIHELRPVALDGRGLPAALRDYARDWSRQNEVDVNVRVKGERALPLEAEQALFRIAQEALANVARHSGAEHAEVRLLYDELGVTLTVTDDGQGFDVETARPGFGLRSMQERAAALGGAFRVQSAPGRETRISVRCPDDCLTVEPEKHTPEWRE